MEESFEKKKRVDENEGFFFLQGTIQTFKILIELLKCFKSVPENYFDEGFRFNLQYLNPQIKKVNGTLEKVDIFLKFNLNIACL